MAETATGCPPEKTAQTLIEFKAYLAEIQDLGHASALLGWDRETLMPPGGIAPRASASGTLAKLSHQYRTSTVITDFLNTLSASDCLKTLSPVNQALVSEVQRDVEKQQKLPADLVQEFSQVTSEAQHIWQRARKDNDFKAFSPWLEKIADLNRRRAECLGYEDSPYDALLDLYERDLTSAQLTPLFASLKDTLVPLLQKIQASGIKADGAEKFAPITFNSEKQKVFCQTLLKSMGYDFHRGVMAVSAHPFSCGIGTPSDVRLTIRYKLNDPREAIATGLHEGGHAVYEQGIDPALARTPLGTGVSLGIHESQSRLWENNVGRSQGFWQHFFPVFAEVFPEVGQIFDANSFYQAMSEVRPSLIRTESDEVTYNLHILVRYEIEKDLIEGKTDVLDLPEIWREKMNAYLGVTPNTDSNGVLQDVHWSMGAMGYFPTYTLGNLYAAQFFNTAKKALPTLESDIANGTLLPLKQWLNKQIHHVGASETPDTIVRRVTGEALNPTYFTSYLTEKYVERYGLD
ncbi:MAG: carboxypeptidase M32 [Vampirovibrio sp.]|nr:carboxypeptidase M32 [Vampirovibrio sp.]